MTFKVREQAQEQVRNLMSAQDGRCLSSVKGPNESVLEFWQIRGTTVIVQYFLDGGWHNYLGSRVATLDDTLAEMVAWTSESQTEADSSPGRDFSKAETAAVLAGLRLLQTRSPSDTSPWIEDIWTCGGEVTPLEGSEIDDLCEFINPDAK